MYVLVVSVGTGASWGTRGDRGAPFTPLTGILRVMNENPPTPLSYYSCFLRGLNARQTQEARGVIASETPPNLVKTRLREARKYIQRYEAKFPDGPPPEGTPLARNRAAAKANRTALRDAIFELPRGCGIVFVRATLGIGGNQYEHLVKQHPEIAAHIRVPVEVVTANTRTLRAARKQVQLEACPTRRWLERFPTLSARFTYKTLRVKKSQTSKQVRAAKLAKSTLTAYELFEAYTQQNGKCYYTGHTLVDRHLIFGGVSIDRIDCSRSYEKGNVVLTWSRLNSARNDMDIDEFILMCRTVARANPTLYNPNSTS